MNPNIWGPHLWHFLHTITLNYPSKPSTQQQTQMWHFLYSLQFVLPCSCQENYTKHLTNHPPPLYSQRKLFRWMVDLHNDINVRNRKRTYTYDEVKQMYYRLYSLPQ